MGLGFFALDVGFVVRMGLVGFVVNGVCMEFYKWDWKIYIGDVYSGDRDEFYAYSGMWDV